MPLPAKDYYRPGEVAKHFSIPLRTFYRHIKREVIEAVRIGGQYRIPRSEVERLEKRDEDQYDG